MDTLEWGGKILGQQHRTYSSGSSGIVPVGVDGYLTGVNVSNADIPMGVKFNQIVIWRKFGRCRVGSPAVLCHEDEKIRLRLCSVEWFRHSLDLIPRGHGARVLLEGEGLATLATSLESLAFADSLRLKIIPAEKR